MMGLSKPQTHEKKEDVIMVKVASLFSQLLQHFSRADFATLVKEHQAERNAKGFSSWDQFVAMLFAQLANARSLRDICNGLHCATGKLVHLGLNKAPCKSTLAYANQHRPAELFRELFYQTYARFQQSGVLFHRKAKFKFKNRFLSFDSTTISLCLSLFPWAKFRRAKGGVKVHLALDHDSYMPSFAVITTAKVHDVRIARALDLNRGSIVAFDRGYTDYALFHLWTMRGVYFVTLMKENAVYQVVEDLPLPQHRNILSDQIIRLTGAKALEKCPDLLRRIVVWDKEHEREIVILTNHLEFGSTTIADIYKDRWEIELFFKAIKQNLKIKTFVGTSENALRIQIWTALIAILLLKWLHHLSKAGWSFSTCAAMTRMLLFTYRDLQEWLNEPYESVPIIPLPEQLDLFKTGFGQPTALEKG